MPIGSAFSLVAPLRLLYLVGEPSGSAVVSDETRLLLTRRTSGAPGRLSMRAGIGLRFSVSRGRD